MPFGGAYEIFQNTARGHGGYQPVCAKHRTRKPCDLDIFEIRFPFSGRHCVSERHAADRRGAGEGSA